MINQDQQVMDFLMSNEGKQKQVQYAHHPGNQNTDAFKNSGVTISYGVDFGNRTAKEVQQSISGIIKDQRAQILKKAAGLKGNQARKFVQQNKIKFEDKQNKLIFQRQFQKQKKDMIRILNSKAARQKYGYQNGEQFYNKLPVKFKKVLMDTKYLGLNNPSYRQKIIPLMKKYIQGKINDAEKNQLTQNIINPYQKKHYDYRSKNVKQALVSQNSKNQFKINNTSDQIMAKLSQQFGSDIKNNSVDSLYNLLNQNNINQIGGVDLSFANSTHYFDGYYFGKDYITLHKGKKGDLVMKDLIVPLRIMFDDTIKNKNMAVSLDPYVPTQPDGPFQKKVYYPQQLQGTNYGKVMIQADYIMKQIKLGLNQKGEPFKYPQSLKKIGLDFDSLLKYRQKGVHERTRQWIVIKNVQQIKVSKNKVAIGKVSMGIQARAQKIGNNGILIDAQEKISKSTEMFCQIFTENYDLIAKQYPQFEVIKTFAKASIIARSMKLKGCQINFQLIKRLYEHQKIDKSQNKVATLKRDFFYEKLQSKIMISGGCQLNYVIQTQKGNKVYNQNPEKQQTQTVPDDLLTEAQAKQYVPFIFQDVTKCHYANCTNICSPQYYSVLNKQCQYHTRMRCDLCFYFIKAGQKYKDLQQNKQQNDFFKYCHASCFKCFGCQKQIENVFVTIKGNQYYHKQCIPQVVLGKCQICSKDITNLDAYMKKGEQSYLHKQCLSKKKCKACSKQLSLDQIKYINNQIYHPTCIKCQYCQKVIQENQFRVLKNGFSHEACIPKVSCFKCKNDISGQYLILAENKYHKECVTCQACSKAIDISLGVKMDQQKRFYHGNCI